MILAMLFLPVMTNQTNLEFWYDFSHVTLANNDNCYSLGKILVMLIFPLTTKKTDKFKVWLLLPVMIKQMNLKFGNYISHVTLANNDKTDIFRVFATLKTLTLNTLSVAV